MKNLKMRDELGFMELLLQKAKIVLEGAVNDIDEKTMFAKEHAPETLISDVTGWALGGVMSTQLDIVQDYILETLEKIRVLCGVLDAEREAERMGSKPAA